MKKIEKDLYKKQLGCMGEKEATLFLKNKGYTIIDRNFRCKVGEIDIIAKKSREYVFVEVKTRTSKRFGNPVDAINKNKMKHIINSSKYFILKNNLKNCFIRFDIIEVVLDNNKVLINHLKNVFY